MTRQLYAHHLRRAIRQLEGCVALAEQYKNARLESFIAMLTDRIELTHDELALALILPDTTDFSERWVEYSSNVLAIRHEQPLYDGYGVTSNDGPLASGDRVS